MKLRNLIILPALLAVACTGNNSQLTVETVTCSDSTEYVHFNAEFQFPKANDEVSGYIRQQLIQIASEQLGSLLVFEDDIPMTSISDIPELIAQSMIVKDSLNTLSKLDYDMSRELIPGDEEMQSYIPAWDEDVNISLLIDTTDYCVFLSQNYTYMGGAHGGVSGAGYMTFLKSDGNLFLDFIIGDNAEPMQDLLRKGIAEYLSECGENVEPDQVGEYLLLFNEDGIIPLPKYAPCPGAEGLTFLYQQYEIAPYAMGMPSFTISYQDLEPFMTEEAKALFLK